MAKKEIIKCISCRGDLPRMLREDAIKNLKKLEGWNLKNNKIKKTFIFKDFEKTMKFVNKVADIAEEQSHHPDMCVYYGRADITLWTHKIKGLYNNDFIIASIIDKIDI